MRIFPKSPYVYGGVCFLILFAIALFLHESGQPYPLLTAPAQLMERAGSSDPGSFIKGAMDIAAHGWLTPEKAWIGNLWPPGFMLLEGLIIKIGGADVPIVLAIQIFACVALAMTMTLQRQVLLSTVGLAASSLLPLTLLLFQMPRVFLVEDYGVVLGETFSVSFFLTAIFLLILSLEKGRIRLALWAGVFFASAAYFRSQYEIIVLGMTGSGVLILAFKLWRARKNKTPLDDTFKTILVVIVTAHILMLPWRIHHYISAGKPSWVFTSDLIAHNSLTPVETLIQAGGGFVVNGGGYLACHYEPSYCGKTESKYFYKAFFRHMPQWVLQKAKLFPEYWFRFNTPPSYVGHESILSAREIVSNGLFLICLIGLVILLVRFRTALWWQAIAWQAVSFAGAYSAIYILAHLEYRYLYLPKILAFTMFVTFTALAWQSRSVRAARSPTPSIVD